MAPDEENVVVFRLGMVEQGLKDLRTDLTSQLSGVRADVQAQGFVPLTLYASEREAMKESIKAVNARVDGIRNLTTWAIGLTFAAAGFVVALVRAFGR
jgi:hypothetical protein